MFFFFFQGGEKKEKNDNVGIENESSSQSIRVSCLE